MPALSVNAITELVKYALKQCIEKTDDDTEVVDYQPFLKGVIDSFQNQINDLKDQILARATEIIGRHQGANEANRVENTRLLAEQAALIAECERQKTEIQNLLDECKREKDEILQTTQGETAAIRAALDDCISEKDHLTTELSALEASIPELKRLAKDEGKRETEADIERRRAAEIQRLETIRIAREAAFVAPTAKSATLTVNEDLESDDSESDAAVKEFLLASGTGQGLKTGTGGRNRKSKKHYKNKKNKTKKRIF